MGEHKHKHPTCITCKHCVFNEAIAKQGFGECWLNPPTPFALFDGKGAMVAKYGLNPPVNLAAQWCSHHTQELVSIPTKSEIVELTKDDGK